MMRWMLRAFCMSVLLVSVPSGVAEEPLQDDPWDLVRALEGSWQGEAEGFGQVSDVTHQWRFVLGGKFLRLETRSVVRSEDGDGEARGDVGFMSWDGDDKTLRFRHFLSEGFVNTFRIEPAKEPDRGVDFEPEGSENAGGMLARMTLRFLGDDSYTIVLALGSEGKLTPCQTMRMQRLQ